MTDPITRFILKMRSRREPDPLVREAMRTGRREWRFRGNTLRLLDVDEELAITAEQRWARHNERARAAGCPCGKPATTVRYHGVTGSVPRETWACIEHREVAGWSWSGDGQPEPHWRHDAPCPLNEIRGSGGRIGGPTSYWLCPHRTHGSPS